MVQCTMAPDCTYSTLMPPPSPSASLWENVLFSSSILFVAVQIAPPDPPAALPENKQSLISALALAISNNPPPLRPAEFEFTSDRLRIMLLRPRSGYT